MRQFYFRDKTTDDARRLLMEVEVVIETMIGLFSSKLQTLLSGGAKDHNSTCVGCVPSCPSSIAINEA
jgi:hypothetical protein